MTLATAGTVARGAVIERSLVKRWARRQRLNAKESVPSRRTSEVEATIIGYRCALDDLIEWLDTQPARTKRKGGIGR